MKDSKVNIREKKKDENDEQYGRIKSGENDV